MWKGKGIRIALKKIFKKSNGGEISLPNFKIYCVATVIKIVGYWWRDRHIDQWNRIKNLETHPYKYT